ncbi:Filament-like plant protein [Dillenia turbinata]|uniref:Filament-like plant protein n=1 Tax=Dillenia turbinata TaxID=194707 RepID=A0AAN8V6L7_9MAGN
MRFGFSLLTSLRLWNLELGFVNIKPFCGREREIAAAAEKLAECQETVYLLGRKLKALQPQKDIMGTPQIKKTLESSDSLMEDKPHTSTNSVGTRRSNEYDQTEMHYMSSPDVADRYEDSPLHFYNSASSPTHVDGYKLLRSPGNSNQQIQKPPKYNSSATSLVVVPENHPRVSSDFQNFQGNILHEEVELS